MDSDEKRVGRISLGARGPIPGILSAYDVLQAWLKMEWYPGPRTRDLLRRRTEALLRAFGIGSLHDFEWGDFLDGRRVEEFPRIASIVQELTEQERREFDLPMFFHILIRHRRAVQELSRATSFDLISGAAPVLAVKVAQRAESRLWEDIAEEDAILMEMISPDDRRFSETEMVERWGFPIADLDELICEEW
jgi:hypothetical protein